MQLEITKDFIAEIEHATRDGDTERTKSMLAGLHAADISSVLYELDPQEAKFVISLLDDEVSADIISNLDDDIRKRFLRNFTPEEIARLIRPLDSDDAVDILQEQPVKEREQVIALINDPEKAKNILDLLRYEEDCAGGLMAKELIKCNLNLTVSQCIEEIRRQAENIDKVYSIYVVDDRNVLVGKISLKRIILTKGDAKVADIYDPNVISVETYLDEEEVADIMQKYDLEAVPVVNVHGKLLGRITIDDIVDVITEGAEEERQLMSGISEKTEEDDSVWMLSRARLPWLIIGMAGGILGARFIGIFESDLVIIPAMAFFIPLITATGGNVGIQSSTIIVQSLANKNSLSGSYLQRAFKILMVSMINGLVIAVVAYGFNMLLKQQPELSFVVSVALFSVVVLSSFMGTFVPIMLNRLGVNPALASGPFITTVNDLLGLGVYFMVAHILLL